MAMRPRYRAGSQPRQPMRPSYQRFKPKSEWSSDNDGLILLVYLPGFVKEQVKVMVINVDNIGLSVKVEGQRPLGGGRWSLFSELYRIPETCDINKIDIQFQGGVLTIVMPNKKIDEAQKTEATQEMSSPNKEIAETSDLQEGRREEKEKHVEPLSPNNKKATTSEEKSQKAQDETSSQQKTDPLIDPAKVGSVGESANEKSQMVVEASSSKAATLLADTAEQTDREKISVGSAGESSDRKGDEKEKPMPMPMPMPVEVEKPGGGAAAAQKTEEKQNGDQTNIKEDDSIAEKSKDMDAKHESDSDSERRQLLLNMATAALVILGFGAYLVSTVGSFGKA